jgi:class 3 adenylate cyclase
VLPRGTIETAGGGYRLLSSTELDVVRFERLLGEASAAAAAGNPRRAAGLLEEALGQWRGDPLLELSDQPVGAAEATRLVELHRTAVEDLFEARLRLGEHQALVGNLDAAAAAEPLREKRWAQLMLALYRCGRQADALRAYQRLRGVLAEELGLEPSEQTRTLEAAILVQDPRLAISGAGDHETRPEIGRLPSGNVTFLFTDVEGSTQLFRTLGDRFVDVIEDHRQIIRGVVTSRQGVEVKTEGDGFFIAFGDAAQAAGACVDAQRRLAEHKWPEGGKLRVRMGLHTGIATPTPEGDYLAIAVHQAARICAAARGGQTLLSAQTAAILHHALPEPMSVVDRGLFMLAGFDEPERIFQLAHPDLENSLEALRAPSVESSSLPLPEDLSTAGWMNFVGRQSDLQQVLAEAQTLAPQSCEGGEGEAARAVWILGEPGVGKTRFAAEVATMAHERGALVLFGRCDELVQDPYQPFVQALRWYVNHRTTAQLATSLGGDPAPLARLVPELGSRFPSILNDIGGATEVEQHRLFESVQSWLAGLGVGGPVVLVIDDAHWADRPTQAMLAHMLKSAAPTRLLVLVTARDTDPDTNDLLASIIDQLARSGRSRGLRLEGLDAVEVASLISSTTLQVDDPDRLAQQIVDETAGNPLFIGAVLAGLEARGSGDDTGPPSDIVSAVRTRVRRLDPKVQDLLQVAALVGIEFSLLVIASAHGIAEIDALTGLESAVRAALVDEIAVNRFRFAHGLVRDVLYADVSASRRARIHASIAASIQSTFAENLDPHLRSLAHHCAASELPDLQEKAIQFAHRAAKQAIEQVAFLAAVDDLSFALEMADRIGAPVSLRY